jgi:hypothetical protein
LIVKWKDYESYTDYLQRICFIKVSLFHEALFISRIDWDLQGVSNCSWPKGPIVIDYSVVFPHPTPSIQLPVSWNRLKKCKTVLQKTGLEKVLGISIRNGFFPLHASFNSNISKISFFNLTKWIRSYFQHKYKLNVQVLKTWFWMSELSQNLPCPCPSLSLSLLYFTLLLEQRTELTRIPLFPSPIISFHPCLEWNQSIGSICL